MIAYSEVLDALGDGTRRQIFEMLRAGPRSVNEIKARLPVSQPAVSQHLRVLREAGLVTVTPQGARRIYRVSAEGLEALREYVESFWSQVLDAFKELVDE